MAFTKNHDIILAGELPFSPVVNKRTVLLAGILVVQSGCTAPKEAESVNVHVYKLENDDSWQVIGGGSISSGVNEEYTELLSGTFTVQMQEHYRLDFNVNYKGRVSFSSEEIYFDPSVFDGMDLVQVVTVEFL